MRTHAIKIVDIAIMETLQLGYCGTITFEYYDEKQFTPVTSTIKITKARNFNKCLNWLKMEMKAYVKKNRAPDYIKQRKSAGWAIS